VGSGYSHQYAEQLLRDSAASQYQAWILQTKGALWDRLEKQSILRALAPTRDDVILDAGSGVGRHSLLLASKAKAVVALDFSWKSLALLGVTARLNGLENLQPIFHDLSQPLPVATSSVQKVLCSQVLQHIPDPAKRRDILTEFFRILRPGGLVVVIVYRWGGAIRSSKQGAFDNGLYWYAFTPQECISILTAAGFSHPQICGMINLRRLSYLPTLLWPLATKIEMYLQALPLSSSVGKFLLATAIKPHVS